ncbi:MAG TPA: SOS response-associated peptidase [Rhizomicrobium sp.]|nr:SOS response-associated peptidase [Rhizomicrobium sp.]
MCGKFTQMMSWREVVAYSQLLAATGDVETVTPMRLAHVVTLDESGARKSVPMRWGMVARGAKDPMSGMKHIHARAETIDTLPTFREAFAQRRGLVAVTTFNEAKELSPTKREQQVITPKDGKPLAIAVIWERWTHRNEGELLTFAMVTVPPNRLIATVTDRMPAFLAPDEWSKWLGEEPASVEDLKALLKPVEGDWDMRPQTKAPPPPKPQKPKAQEELF